jgi:hypothetical protein
MNDTSIGRTVFIQLIRFAKNLIPRCDLYSGLIHGSPLFFPV